jgi:hypothetical protein
VVFSTNKTDHHGISDKAYQLLVHGRWFSLGTPASSTTKTGRHEIAEILLKVALNSKKSNPIPNISEILMKVAFNTTNIARNLIVSRIADSRKIRAAYLK